MNIREQFEKETGIKAVGRVTDGIHSVPAFESFSFKYMKWIEQQMTEIKKGKLVAQEDVNEFFSENVPILVIDQRREDQS